MAGSWHWVIGLAAGIWILLRSGANPKRLSYPCQQAAFPIAANWILGIVAMYAGSLFLKRFTRISMATVLAVCVVWLIGIVPHHTVPRADFFSPLPVWESDDPVSVVFVMDSIPQTSGSLAAGNQSVPYEYLSDPAIDTLLAMLSAKGINLCRTTGYPDGLVGADNIVVIKGNFQWESRNTTSTDRVKGLIWRILNHPEGFGGEILVCDNTQDIGTGINDNDNNSDDTSQSIVDVVSTFYSKNYPVYLMDWNVIWGVVAGEYSEGDYGDGYVYESDTKVSYPKFRTPSGDYFVSLRYGIWDSLAASYDSTRLCIIDFPILKAHVSAGATIAVKNWVGVLTTAYADERYGGWSPMHGVYFYGSYALVARVMAVTFPDLTIVDADWTTTDGPENLDWVEHTNMLAASTDPVAASWYTAKYILTPIARYPDETNPDPPGYYYRVKLSRWTAFLADSAGFPCTMDSARISVYDREVLVSTDSCGDANSDNVINVGDPVYIINYVFREGAAPEPLCIGDANGDTKVNVGDAVYLINHVFRGGAAPISGCCP